MISGDQIEAEINQFAPEKISRFFLFDGELLQEYEELLVEGSEQGRQIKEAIEQVLGVPALINGRTELGSILKSATKRQSQEMAHVQGLERQAEQTTRLTTRLETLERDLENLQQRLNNTRDNRAKLEDELEAAATVLALKASLDAARASLKTHSDTRDKKRIERQSLLALAWQDLLDAKLDVKRGLLGERQRQLTDAIKVGVRIQARIEDVRKLLATNACPTCEQIIGIERRGALGATLGKLEVEAAKFGDATEEPQQVAAQLGNLSKIRGVNARDRLVEIDRDARSAEVGAQRAENEIEQLQEKIAGHDTAELARKRVLLGETLKEEGRLTEAMKLVRKDIDKTKGELAVARTATESMASARSRRSTLKVSVTADLEKVFSTSIERLRDRLRERVGALASESFKRMTTQKAYRGLDINPNYGLSILDSAGRRVSLRSAGAEQVVALSLIDGLNRTGRAIGPVVMDTPFGRLDPKHRDNILTYLPTVTSQFVLLVHAGEIRPETDLASIKSRIGAAYVIEEISENQSRIRSAAL